MAEYLDPEKVAQETSNREKPSPGVTLVAAFGNRKPRAFAEAMQFVRASLKPWLNKLPPLKWRPDRQLHMTLIGLEAERTNSSGKTDFININLANYLKDAIHTSTPVIDLTHLLDVLRSFAWPLVVQFGGFPFSKQNPCDPDHTPYERSFFIRPGGKVVSIGFPPDLAPGVESLRQECRSANVLHKYHGGPGIMDNDMFTVVGDFVPFADDGRNREWSKFYEAQDKCREEIRQKFASNPAPFQFPISEAGCEFIFYKFTTLAGVKDEHRVPLADATPQKLHKMLLVATS